MAARVMALRRPTLALNPRAGQSFHFSIHMRFGGRRLHFSHGTAAARLEKAQTGTGECAGLGCSKFSDTGMTCRISGGLVRTSRHSSGFSGGPSSEPQLTTPSALQLNYGRPFGARGRRSLTRCRMRRVRWLLADAPLSQPHPLQDCLGQEQRQAPIELRPQVPAQYFLGSPGNRPFGRVRVGQVHVLALPQRACSTLSRGRLRRCR